MTDLPKTLRARLAEEGLAAPMDVALFHRSNDGTRKMLLRLADGKDIESVLLPQGAPGDLAQTNEEPE